MQNFKRKIYLLMISVILVGGFLYKTEITTDAAYSVKVQSNDKPYKNQYTNYTTYNEYTKQYYMLRSYLEKLEKTGGTLILDKGTYVITNVLYVPSNVTIELRDGVIIKKGTKTGTNKIKPSKSIFQLIRPSNSLKKDVYGGYKGEHNIKLVGKGKAIIDLMYDKDSIAIIMGHNSNISIEGIEFRNMNSGHFIEMDASKDVTIKGCTFKNHKDSANNNKEAINLDTPDKNTKGWSQLWTKWDKTPNKSIVIKENKFYNLERAIGTHKYSAGKLHTDVSIEDNMIDGTDQDAIRIMNWKDTVIRKNTIKNVAKGEGIFRGILLSGVSNPSISGNVIMNAARPMQFFPWKNSGPGSEYPIIYNSLSQENLANLKNNTVIGVKEPFVRINELYGTYENAITIELIEK